MVSRQKSVHCTQKFWVKTTFNYLNNFKLLICLPNLQTLTVSAFNRPCALLKRADIQWPLSKQTFNSLATFSPYREKPVKILADSLGVCIHVLACRLSSLRTHWCGPCEGSLQFMHFSARAILLGFFYLSQYWWLSSEDTFLAFLHSNSFGKFFLEFFHFQIFSSFNGTLAGQVVARFSCTARWHQQCGISRSSLNC